MDEKDSEIPGLERDLNFPSSLLPLLGLLPLSGRVWREPSAESELSGEDEAASAVWRQSAGPEILQQTIQAPIAGSTIPSSSEINSLFPFLSQSSETEDFLE